MNDIMLDLITLFHTMFLIFMVAAPFSDSNYLMLLHSLFVPFLLLHWYLNDNTCVLTKIERFLRKRSSGVDYEDDDCITCRLIEPVYDFRKDHEEFSLIIQTITLMLWAMSTGKLYYKYKTGKIDKWQQLFLV